MRQEPSQHLIIKSNPWIVPKDISSKPLVRRTSPWPSTFYDPHSHESFMAQSLSQIFRTEWFEVNCPFCYWIGASRYGDRCIRLHSKALYSQRILMAHMYENLVVALVMFEGTKVDLRGDLALWRLFRRSLPWVLKLWWLIRVKFMW